MRIGGIYTPPVSESVRETGERPIGPYERRPVTVSPWDPNVIPVAERVGAIIRARRPELRVEHIGSTAVPGLPGKGIVDLATETDAAAIPDVTAAMYELGFGPQPGPDPWPPERPMLVGSYALAGREYRIHLHVQPVGGDFPLDLRFRDALREDPALAADYARVKEEIVAATDGPLDGPVYQDGKGAWIVETFDRLGIPRPRPSAARRQEVGS
jgi:dephospho-CoA kinase